MTTLGILVRLAMAGFLLTLAFGRLFPHVSVGDRATASGLAMGTVGLLAGAWEMG